MKKKFLLLLIALVVAMSANSQVTVCGVSPDENGNFNTPYIKSGSVTWNDASHTLTLNNAVVEYSSDNTYDGVRTIRVTEDATIVIEGKCYVTNTGHVALSLESYNVKNITIKGSGTLFTSSSWLDIFLVAARLTIKDITLQTVKGIANNTEGASVALTFDNVQASIKGTVSRIGEGITFKNCAITYPADAYIEQTDYGYSIYCGNHSIPNQIIISRKGIKGDVNGDGEVNIADVNAIINIILGGSGNTSAADVNGDHEVNIADVNSIINIILGGASEEPAPPDVETFTVNGVTFKMIQVKGGTFTMGATPEQGEDATDSERPAHLVTLSDYSIGETEVTQELWLAVMGTNPSRYSSRNGYEENLQRPVEYVLWGDCQNFIIKLNQLTGKNFRCPTEAEWEYAARGGKMSKGYKYAGSNNPDDVAWYWGNIPSQTIGTDGYGTQTVATKAPNELGLYDMSGNVLEWCQDWYGGYSDNAQTNPTGPASGTYKVLRGGCWYNGDKQSRVSRRFGLAPNNVYNDYVGLRLAL